MDRLASMSAFVAVVASGSFVRAAERLGTSTSSLSRQIAELEQHLGARLLNRTTRKLSLTEGGRAFYERVLPLLTELDEIEGAAGRAAAAPHGTLRLTCSHSLGVQRVVPAIASFVERYSQVRFEVSVSDRFVDLVEEGFDLAVRVGHVGSDQLVARRLGTMQLLACAAPAYLKARGIPRRPEDLAQHAVLTYANMPNPNLWRLTDKWGKHCDIRVSGPLHSNGGELVVAAAIAGMGVIFEPDFAVQSALDAGLLTRVMPEFNRGPLEIWAVYPSRRHLSAKVRLFVDHLVEQFAGAKDAQRKRRGVR